VSPFTMGTAVKHILAGDVDAGSLRAAQAGCAWCQEPRSNRECWHADAQVLLAQGLRALPRASLPPGEPGLWEVSP
jgi:hypothetical protein